MKIAYAGTPSFAVPALQGLIDADCEIVGVWTQPDRPAGRGRKLTPGQKRCAGCRLARSSTGQLQARGRAGHPAKQSGRFIDRRGLWLAIAQGHY